MNMDLEAFRNTKNPIHPNRFLELDDKIEELLSTEQDSEKIEYLTSLRMDPRIKLLLSEDPVEREKVLESIQKRKMQSLETVDKIKKYEKELSFLRKSSHSSRLFLAYQLYAFSTFDKGKIDACGFLDDFTEGDFVSPKTEEERKVLFQKYLDLLEKQAEKEGNKEEWLRLLVELIESHALSNFLPETRIIQVVEKCPPSLLGKVGKFYLQKQQEGVSWSEEEPEEEKKESYFHFLKEVKEMTQLLQNFTTTLPMLDYFQRKGIHNGETYHQVFRLFVPPTNPDFYQNLEKIQTTLEDCQEELSKQMHTDREKEEDQREVLWNSLAFYREDLYEIKESYRNRVEMFVREYLSEEEEKEETWKEKYSEEEIEELNRFFQEGKGKEKELETWSINQAKENYFRTKMEEWQKGNLSSKISEFQLLFYFHFSKQFRNILCNFIAFSHSAKRDISKEKWEQTQQKVASFRQETPSLWQEIVDALEKDETFRSRCEKISTLEGKEAQEGKEAILNRYYELQEQFFTQKEPYMKELWQEIKIAIPTAHATVHTTKFIFLNKETPYPKGKEVTDCFTNIHPQLIEIERKRLTEKIEEMEKESLSLQEEILAIAERTHCRETTLKKYACDQRKPNQVRMREYEEKKNTVGFRVFSDLTTKEPQEKHPSI